MVEDGASKLEVRRTITAAARFVLVSPSRDSARLVGPRGTVLCSGTMTADNERKFAVLAQKKDHDAPLYLHGLSFARLMDDVVVPYETKQPFFIDGVPVKRDDLVRIKIVQQSPDFERSFNSLHFFLERPSSGKSVRPQDYPQRLDALYRGSGEDVTAQIIKAYEAGIGSKIKEYLPKREELISAAFSIFVESMKRLARGGA
jgi:hypothetical protein